MSKVFAKVTLVFVFVGCLFVTVNAQKKITPATALTNYLNNGDKTFKWEEKDIFTVGDVTVHALVLTSQNWRDHIWTHQLSIIVPNKITHDGGMLFITGGSITKQGQPNNWSGKDDDLTIGFSNIAKQNNAVVAVLKQVPNQPFYDDLTEDALISYTLHQFKSDNDYSWPLLFPMVKSGKRAMDAIQEFCKQTLNKNIKTFVMSGASKRGWTTWLTGASDNRVVAIAPMVIDMLNMPVSMNYKLKVWNDYSIQIEDYVKLGIVQDMGSNKSNDLVTMIDPFSYRKKLTMPKMLIMGTNDEYWPIDNVKNYFDSIPGNNFIHYIPNVGHSMGDKKESSANLSSFFAYTLANKTYPVCSWKTTTTNNSVKVTLKATANKLTNVVIWYADSPDKDFRNDAWKSKSLNIKNKSTIVVTEELPTSGYKAFYVNLQYTDPNGVPFSESTRVFMTDNKTVL